MSEDNEVLMLLKALVEKVNKLEKAVYDNDNMLMKSGFVVVDTPTPSMSVSNTGDVDNIAKMDWQEIGALVSKMEGGY
tara:strand:- start:1596 stop:1829 length:234 start_codon:yes stop_codon:yes gene_type:complete